MHTSLLRNWFEGFLPFVTRISTIRALGSRSPFSALLPLAVSGPMHHAERRRHNSEVLTGSPAEILGKPQVFRVFVPLIRIMSRRDRSSSKVHIRSTGTWPRLGITGLQCVFALISFCFISSGAYAQVTTADVVGTVTDATGAIVPNANITITNSGTRVTATTRSNNAGSYVFSLLEPGRYSISIQAPGFKTISIPNLSLAAGDRDRADATLQTGDIQQTVEVQATEPLLQAETSAVSSVVTERSVQDLPLNGRNYISLVTIQPGVNAGPPNSVSSGQRPDDRRQSSTVSANGQSDQFNNEMIDGMDNNEREQGFIGVRPSIEAIAEVRVDTNVYNAAVGRNAGAIVNIITKSGTDTFHGSAYDFFRNDIFDSRDFFARQGVTNKPEYRQNQFGGSIGGPIVKDKTFFFADVEDLRIIQGQSSGLLTVPTLYQEQHPGDFSDIGGPIVPASALNPVGLNYFKLYPAPNVPGAGITNNFESVTNRTQYALSLDGKIDQHFRNGDVLFGRYSYNNVNTVVPGAFPAVSVAGTTVQPGPPNYNGPSITKVHGVQFNYVHTITPSLILELKAGYSRIDIDTQTANQGNNNASSSFGLINVNTPLAPETGGLMPVSFNYGGYSSLGDSGYLPIVDLNNTFQYMGSLIFTRGNHSILLGGGILRRQLNYFQSPQGLGSASFAESTGNSLEDLLTGNAFSYSRNNDLIKPGYRAWENSAYIQDDWRVTHSLTLNLGLRYDVFTAFTEAHNRYANFDYPTLTLITGNQDPHIGINTSYTNVAPRIGFAQSLGKGTVVRGGYGISYYPTTIQGAIQDVNPPNFFATTCSPCAPFWPTLPNPTPSSTTNLSGSLTYIPPNFNTTRIQQFNVMVQQQIGKNVFSIGYVGDVGTHLQYQTTVNRPNPTGPYPNDATTGPPPTPALLTATQLPNVTSVMGWLPTAITNYNSMQVVFVRRFTQGLAFNANYTWAHGLGDTGNASSQATVSSILPNDPHYDYGNDVLDIRQRFAMNLTYNLPFGENTSGAKSVLAKGWSVNFIDYWQTGLPFTVGNSFQNPHGVAQVNLPLVGTDRPDVLPYPAANAMKSTLSHWFNYNAFTPQAAGTLGDEKSDQLYGPHQRRADLSLAKEFKVTEKDSFQFRAECYNISNTPNFSFPNGNISGWAPGPAHGPNNPISTVGLLPGDVATSAGGVGTISSTALGVNPRQFQFALKFLF